jgi:hypothetical protein
MAPDQESPTATVAPIVGPILVAGAVHALIFACYIGGFGGDMSALICVDKARIGNSPFERVSTGFPKGGYDGQYYYALARSPFSFHGTDVIDFPAYRQARILYPSLAWLLSGGDPDLLLWVMPAINLAAIMALAGIGARLALHYQRSAWWGCLLPVVVNAGMPALRDLTDPLAVAMVAALLAAHLLNRPAWQLAIWAAAALSREQNVAIVLLISGDAALQRRWDRVVALAAGGLLWFGWILTLRVSYAEWPVSAATMGVPAAGIWHCITHLTGQYGRPPLLNVAGMCILLLQLTLGAIAVVRVQRLIAAVALSGIALAVLGGVPIYESSWSYARVFLWIPLGVWVWSIQSGRTWPMLLLIPGGFWFLLAAAQPWVE